MGETNVSCVSGGQQPIAFSTQRLMVSCALNANAKKSLRLDMLQPAALCTAHMQAEAHRQTTAVSDEGPGALHSSPRENLHNSTPKQPNIAENPISQSTAKPTPAIHPSTRRVNKKKR
jgi:hypothetical protein